MDLNIPGFKTAEIDGKRIAYSEDTEFLVQVGYRKGSYKTKYSFKGDLGRACMFYDMINTGLGYKKRLLMPSCSKNPVIARCITQISY